jgi:hypothetical protein
VVCPRHVYRESVPYSYSGTQATEAPITYFFRRKREREKEVIYRLFTGISPIFN